MKKTVFILVVFTTLLAKAQKHETVFTVGDKVISTTEFERVYLKNIDLVQDDNQKKIANYLDLYINYQLKLQEAYAQGLNKDVNYQRELERYRKDLLKSYLTDATVTQKLMKEAYDRSLKEVNASHILIRLAEDALPKDTLAAYNKIKTIRDKAVAGEAFDKLAKQYSEDPSAKKNGGNLGYFSVFQMVYPFENAAYTTPKGKISNIFRTRFGYHITKVNDVRPAHGQVEVAHIMVVTNKKNEAEAKEKIQNIYKQLQNGSDFASLAKQLSDDKKSAAKGGRLPVFGINRMVPEFEKVAFSLKNAGDISQPFQSPYGWHIAKLIRKIPLPTFEKAQAQLKSKIANDMRSKLITKAFLEKIKKQYHIKTNNNLIKDFLKFSDTNYQKGLWKPTATLQKNTSTALELNKETKTYADFANYLRNHPVKTREKALEKTLTKQYKQFVDDAVFDYYKAHLEETNSAFANTMQEYRDGVLLFNLMNQEIWDKAPKDTLGLHAYYENNKEKYKWNTRATVLLASVTNKTKAKAVCKLLQAGKSKSEIEKIVNTDKIHVLFSLKKIEDGRSNLPKKYKLKEGVSKVIKEKNNYIVTKTSDIKPSIFKTFDEAKGQIINDYQNAMEKQWLANLHKKYKVVVNQEVVGKLKKKYN